MMGTGAVRPYWIAVGFLTAVSIGLLAYMMLVIGPEFEALVHLTMPDFRLMGYLPADVVVLSKVLATSPEAAGMLRGLHLFPDLLFPACYGAVSWLLLQRHARGATVFHKPLAGFRFWIVVLTPVAYALFDYAENIAGLMLFPPAVPQAGHAAFLGDILPFLTRAKGMLFFVTLILVLRFTFFRERPAADTADKNEEA